MHRNYKSGIISNNTIAYNKIINAKTATPLIINNTTGEIIKSKTLIEPTTPTSRRSSRSYSKSPNIKPQFSTDIDDTSDYEYY
jgi:hypothetical protein